MFKPLVIRPNVDEFNYLDYADLVTFTEEILNGKLRFFAQCDTLSKTTYTKGLVFPITLSQFCVRLR